MLYTEYNYKAICPVHSYDLKDPILFAEEVLSGVIVIYFKLGIRP
jgi:hypothetical protein